MATHKLHALPDGRFYCGPAAIASFTGFHPKEEVRAAINSCRNFRASQGVIGMSNELVEEALTLLGVKHSGFYDVEPREILNGYIKGRGYYNGWKVQPTLKQFVEANPDFCGIVNVSRHYIAVSSGMCQDNQSGAIYPLSRFSGKQKKVQRALTIHS